MLVWVPPESLAATRLKIRRLRPSEGGALANFNQSFTYYVGTIRPASKLCGCSDQSTYKCKAPARLGVTVAWPSGGVRSSMSSVVRSSE
jgi:hypothetical protein